jgi:hypothetical protein
LKIWDYKLLHRGPLEWHYLHTKYHENPPNGSKVISGTHTSTGDLENLFSFLESRLKIPLLLKEPKAVRYDGV